jgi:outer membrane protein assembly factor BamA
MNSRFILIILVASLAGKAMCQEDKEHLFQTDTMRIDKQVQVLGLPVVFYTPETSFGVGGGLQLFFNNKRSEYNERVSNIFSSLIFTTEKQLLLNVVPQIYLFKGKMFLEGDFLYKIFPNSFWGIGGNTAESAEERYNMESISLEVALLNRIPPYLNFGFEYLFEYHKMLEVQEDGMLDTNLIAGAEGARISGFSFVLDYDDRDNVYSPLGGNYLIFKGGFSSRALGASYSFNRYLIDLRKYIPLARTHTFAVQTYLQVANGNVPFQSLSWLGGPERNRGFFRGRYMDNTYLLFQTEMRLKILSRLHLNVFASLGQVSENIRILFAYPKFSGGGGLRFQVLKNNPTLIRMDVGINQYGGTGIYFGVNEAF